MGSDPSLVSAVCQGLPLAAQQVQRQHLVLEASAVASPRGAVILVGGSATGKSSLALSFSLEGFSLLADGVVAVDLKPDGVTSVLPIAGPVEVSQDVLDALSIPAERAPRAREGVPRFWVSGVPWADEVAPLHAVFLLRRKRDGKPEVVPVEGRGRVLSVLAGSFNRFLGEAPEVRQTMLLDATRVLQAVPVFRLTLPERPLQLASATAAVREACGIG